MMLVSETGTEPTVTTWAQGPGQGCQGPALRLWGLREGAGSPRVCEDGTWAPREEAAARMAWAPGVPSGRSARQQL